MIKLPKDLQIRLVVYSDPDDPDVWLAHCIEMDLIGAGDTVQEALEDLLGAIAGQIRNATTAKQVFFPAPQETWDVIPLCRRLPDELLLRATENVFGKSAPCSSTAWASKDTVGRLERELAPTWISRESSSLPSYSRPQEAWHHVGQVVSQGLRRHVHRQEHQGDIQDFTIGHISWKKGLKPGQTMGLRRRLGLIPPAVTDEDFWG
ncbi:MAG: hypothetical protein JXQ73_10965 [Phycisphaerae bacterium]|nr:hypothetical protein [Phycisphaerae bacterium]